MFPGALVQVIDTQIADVKILIPKKFTDPRGFFSETYNRRLFAAHGIDLEFVQDNHSFSARRRVVRGLHYQIPPHAQTKLVRVLRGAVQDVAVDLRRDSPTFGRHVSIELSADNWRQLLVPVGFAHGFCTLEPDTEVLYKVTDFYAPDHERGILWNDPALGINWQVNPADAQLSDRDAQFPPLATVADLF